MATAETILYTTLIGDDEPLEEFPAEIISYGYRLNRSGAISFSLALDHEKTRRANLEEGVHEVVVRRNRAVVWRGPILTTDEDDEARLLLVGGEGLGAHAKKWHVTSTISHSNVDQFTIARSLINHHQGKAGGDFGIDTSAVTTSGVLRTRTYPGYEQKNIYDALVELSEVEDGFDFNIDPGTRAFDLYYPKRGQRTELVFDERNIEKFRRRRDATSQASQILGVGAGEKDDTLRRSSQSSTAVARYKLTQRVATHKDVKVAATLDDHVAAALNAFATVPNVLSIQVRTDEPPLFSYNVGAEVTVRWPSPYDEINEIQRLIGFDVVWQQGKESAILHLQPL